MAKKQQKPKPKPKPKPKRPILTGKPLNRDEK